MGHDIASAHRHLSMAAIFPWSVAAHFPKGDPHVHRRADNTSVAHKFAPSPDRSNIVQTIVPTAAVIPSVGVVFPSHIVYLRISRIMLLQIVFGQSRRRDFWPCVCVTFEFTTHLRQRLQPPNSVFVRDSYVPTNFFCTSPDRWASAGKGERSAGIRVSKTTIQFSFRISIKPERLQWLDVNGLPICQSLCLPSESL